MNIVAVVWQKIRSSKQTALLMQMTNQAHLQLTTLQMWRHYQHPLTSQMVTLQKHHACSGIWILSCSNQGSCYWQVNLYFHFSCQEIKKILTLFHDLIFQIRLLCFHFVLLALPQFSHSCDNPLLIFLSLAPRTGTVDRLGRGLVITEAHLPEEGYQEEEMARLLACYHHITRYQFLSNNNATVIMKTVIMT